MALSSKQVKLIRKYSKSMSADQIAKKTKIDLNLVNDVLQAANKSDLPHNPITGQPGPLKKAIFTLAALSIPVLFFLVFEGILRYKEYRGNTDLFFTMSSLDHQYKVANHNFAARYFFYTSVIPNPPFEPFLTNKPENGFRVFVMGESSAAGYPYGFNGIPGRVIRDALQDAMPDYHVEVITVATSAINTYTLYDQVREILAEAPDAIIIYTGHNEFYGALGVGSNENLGTFPSFVRAYLKIQRLKTFLYLRDQLTGFSKWLAKRSAPPGDRGTETLMQQVVRDQSITLDSPLYEMGKRQFTSNMNRILDAFESAGVPVFIGSLASNLRDHAPFESVGTAELPPAEKVYEQARQRLHDGFLEEAFQLFQYARDLDALKFRATTEFNDLIREQAQRPNTFYVPVKERFIAASRDGIIGNDLMLEHLHPNADGYHLLGMAFVEAIRDADFLGREANPDLIAPDQEYRRRMYLSKVDEKIVEHRLKVLMGSWPFVKSGPGFRYVNYRPDSIEDSLAYEVVANKLRWDRAKVLASEHYLETGQYDRMLYEFKGLMRDQPFNDSPFLITAQFYLDRGLLQEARPYLLHAHSIEASSYTYKMLGSIEVDGGNFTEGIRLLESSLAIQPNDPQTLFNLSGAYAQQGNLEKGLEIVDRLLTISPNFPGAIPWKQQLESVIQQRRR